MIPRVKILLTKYAAFGGCLLTFGIAMSAYHEWNIQLGLLPLWLNFAAILGPMFAGAWLGYLLMQRFTVRCPNCWEPVAFRRCDTSSQWQMPSWVYWCWKCERDVAND